MPADSDSKESSPRADLPCRPGRGDHWIKSKCLERQEFIILGYIPSTAASRSVGSLALGYHDKQKLVYAGRVGTGWSQEQARSLRNELETIGAIKPSFAKPLPVGTEKGVRWVEPRLICEVEYRGPTAPCNLPRLWRVSGAWSPACKRSPRTTSRNLLPHFDVFITCMV
jgi:ATP-dependent DNA ligase